MSKTPTQTMKTTPAALRLLRIVAAATNETQYQVLERILEAEVKRLKGEKQL